MLKNNNKVYWSEINVSISIFSEDIINVIWVVTNTSQINNNFRLCNSKLQIGIVLYFAAIRQNLIH